MTLLSQRAYSKLDSAVGPEAANQIQRGLLFPAFYGKTFYVHSGDGSSGYSGLSPLQPKATIAQALALVTAGDGDRILVMPGHAESLAADLDITTSHNGVSIIGFGNGQQKPILTFITSDAAKIDVDGEGVKIANLVLKNDIDAQVVVVDVDGADCTLEDLDLLEGSSKQFLIGIDIAAARCTVRRCLIHSIAAGANSGIKISAAVDRAKIEDCEIFGDFADAAIHNPTSAIATRVTIRNNSLTNLQSGDHAIELVSACTGVIERNFVNSSLAAAGTAGAIDGGSCFMNQNYGVDATADVQGILNPAADS